MGFLESKLSKRFGPRLEDSQKRKLIGEFISDVEEEGQVFVLVGKTDEDGTSRGCAWGKSDGDNIHFKEAGICLVRQPKKDKYPFKVYLDGDFAGFCQFFTSGNPEEAGLLLIDEEDIGKPRHKDFVYFVYLDCGQYDQDK